MRFGDPEIGEHQGGGFGLHRGTAIGMQGELAGLDMVLCDGVIEQGLEQRGAFSVGNAPGDDPAAENIDDDVEIEVAPFRRPHQLRYIPGPNLMKHDVIAFHHGMRAKGYALGTCNRCLILMRYAMNLAVRWEIPGVTANPTKDVPLFENPNKKERF